MSFFSWPDHRYGTAISIINGTRRPFEEAFSSSESEASDADEDNGGAISSRNYPNTELQQLTQSIIKLVANLFKISTVIRKGNISQDRLLRSSRIDVSYYEPFDMQHAKNKFPSANDALIDRLGKAISRRRQYLKYREQHHEKLANPNQSSTASTRPQKDSQPLREADSKATSEARTDQKPTKPDLSAKVSVSHDVSTTASTFIISNTNEVIDVDVDVYSESGTVSSYQPSVVGDEKLQLPPLPRNSEGGRDFECPYCYTICKLTGTTDWARRTEWKRHMFKDLQPYACTFVECSRADTMFERRSDWFRHETQMHRKEWSCNSLGHNAFQDKMLFMKHMEKEHGESFSQAQLPSVLALCQRPLETVPSSCHLCHSEDAKDLSPKRLEKHLARHLEALALFSLPRNNEKRGSKSVASDLATEASTTTSSPILRTGDKGVEAKSVGSDIGFSDDFFNEESDYRSPFDALIQNFCVFEDSRATRVPLSWNWQIERFFSQEVQSRGWQDQNLVQRTMELLKVGTNKMKVADRMKVADFVLLIYSETIEKNRTHLESLEQMPATPEEVFLLVIRYMVEIFSWNRDMRTRLEDLESDLRDALKSEDNVANGISWAYIKPKVLVADFTIALLSRAIAAVHQILSTSEDEARQLSGWTGDSARDIAKACRNLAINLETLVASIKGVELDQGIVSQMEKECWSEERQIVKLSAISQKGENLDNSISEPSFLFLVDSLNEKVCETLSLLGIDQQAGAVDLSRYERLERAGAPGGPIEALAQIGKPFFTKPEEKKPQPRTPIIQHQPPIPPSSETYFVKPIQGESAGLIPIEPTKRRRGSIVVHQSNEENHDELPFPSETNHVHRQRTRSLSPISSINRYKVKTEVISQRGPDRYPGNALGQAGRDLTLPRLDGEREWDERSDRQEGPKYRVRQRLPVEREERDRRHALILLEQEDPRHPTGAKFRNQLRQLRDEQARRQYEEQRRHARARNPIFSPQDTDNLDRGDRFIRDAIRAENLRQFETRAGWSQQGDSSQKAYSQ